MKRISKNLTDNSILIKRELYSETLLRIRNKQKKNPISLQIIFQVSLIREFP